MLDKSPSYDPDTQTTPQTLARLEAVELSYPSVSGAGPGEEVPVLRGVDMEIAAGEIVGVVGPSGSGKSSLIALIAGLEMATAGRISVLGLDLNQSSEAERTLLRRGDIGIVFQSFHLVPAMTAAQNAALPLLLSGDEQAEEKGAALLSRVGLGHRLDHRPSALSGGEQQRVAIARAFAPSPRLILADEPTGNLDQETGDEVVETMFSLVRETGASLVLVTHDKAIAKRCDRLIEINAGRVKGA